MAAVGLFQHLARAKHEGSNIRQAASHRAHSAGLSRQRAARRCFSTGKPRRLWPGESVAPFIGIADWSKLDSAILDAGYNPLSFFSEGGFRYFLPVYLIADLEERLQTADPLFHLTNGFSDKAIKLPSGQRTYEKTIGNSAFVNSRRYGP